MILGYLVGPNAITSALMRGRKEEIGKIGRDADVKTSRGSSDGGVMAEFVCQLD